MYVRGVRQEGIGPASSHISTALFPRQGLYSDSAHQEDDQQDNEDEDDDTDDADRHVSTSL